MSGSFAGQKRLFNAISADIRDKQDNPAKNRTMRSRAYITKLHTAPEKGDTRASTVMEWMVAKRNIDGNWKIHMESAAALAFQ